MSKNAFMSKTFAAVFGCFTIIVLGGLVTMIIVYNMELKKLNPTAPPTAPVTTLAPPPEMRLRGDVLPQTYRVFIQVHLYTRIIEEVNVTSPNQTMFFNGNVTIQLHCVQKTRTIFLHSREQKISKPVVMDLDKNKNIKVENYNLHNDNTDFLEVHLEKALEVGGNYSLYLAFSGNINDHLEGLFVSTYDEGEPEYEEDTNVERYLAATTMEPTYARTVFPCFDEPAMKARFLVTIIHRRDTTALSNEVAAETNIIDDEWQYTRFQPSQIMSTYLFAFTVSEFTGIKTPHERTINTYARPEATNAGHSAYAAHITGKILSFYQDYFDIGYTQKLDQIALPDLGPAAMENWGLVTYKETGLLYEEGVSSYLHKEVIATLIAHELAHQWFGNLVTMSWWNELWLNEGFASYMSSLAVDHAEPSFKMKEMFITEDLHSAFEADALESSHPLTPPLEDIQDTYNIIEIFDAITYSKGATVLRMLADVLEERVFHKGIKIYLRRFRHQNTNQYDLWDAMKEAQSEFGGHVKIDEVMDTWTNQIGYPVVTINTTSGVATQKHFLYNHSSESSLLWQIPIRVTSAANRSSLEWMYTEKVTKDTFISKKGEWILANVNCAGYYRVNYDLVNWGRLLAVLESNFTKTIPLMNRGQLIDDAFNLARAKQVNVTLALNSTRFLRKEIELLPWESALRNLQYFVLMFDRSEVYGPMQVYLRNQVTALYNYFKDYTDNMTVPEDHSLQHNQINAIKVACTNGLPECVSMATDMFNFWITNNTNRIHPNLRSEVYCQALAAGSSSEWEFAWSKYMSSTNTSEKDQLREALSCTKKIWLLNRYLEYTLDPNKIRLMDVASTISYIAQNEAGQALAWNFIRANWDYVSQLDGAMLIEAVTNRFSTQFELEELKHFSTKSDLGSAYSAVLQAIEQTQVNIKWVQDNREAVLEWFKREIR